MKHTAELSDILSCYALGDAVSLKELRSYTNENYLVKTSSGHSVLRVSRSAHSLEALTFEHRVLRHLANRGFPVATPWPSRSGDTWAVVSGRLCTLTPYIEGKPFRRRHWPHLVASGHGLALYHRLMQSYRDAGDQRDGRQDLVQWLQSTGKTPVLSLPAGERALEEARRYAVACLGHLEQALAWPVSDRLRRSVIHGSLRRANLLFQEDDLVAVLDFDSCSRDVRALDVAIAIKNLCRWSGESFDLDLAQVTAFLAAYQAEEPLSEAEVKALPLLLQVRPLRSVVSGCEQLRRGPWERSGAALKKLLREFKRLRWVKEHQSELAQAIRDSRRVGPRLIPWLRRTQRATSLNNRAKQYQTQGKYAEAELLYQCSLAIREEALGPEHPHVAASLENYAKLLRHMNRGAEATDMEVRAKAIQEKAPK